MKKTHELILLGGLGNQLFILFEAYKILTRNPCDKILLNYSAIALSDRKDRPVLIDQFIFQDNIIMINNGFARFKYYFVAILFKFFNKFFFIKCLRINLFIYNISYSYHQKFIFDNKSNLILSNLRKHFVSNKINTLAVHIRRGDYLEKKHHSHGLVEISLVLNEVNFFISKHEFNSLTIFTDSPDLILLDQFLQFGLPVQIDHGGDAVNVFKRMCSSTGIIGSNSTFSLWAIIIGEPKLSSIPYQWNNSETSHHLGLDNIRRYK